MAREQRQAKDAVPAQGQARLSLTRHINAPPERVFDAWTKPEALKLWFGPSEEYELVECAVDLKVGGRYRLALARSCDDTGNHGVSGQYRTIERGRRLAFTWAWDTTPERVSLVTATFEARDGGTWLTLVHEQLWDEDIKARHEHGWTGSLERMARAAVAGRL